MIAISSQKQSERSGKRSGAGRKTSERERSGERDFRKKRGAGAERRSGNGNGAVSGSPKNWWSVERHFSPLPLRSHALVTGRGGGVGGGLNPPPLASRITPGIRTKPQRNFFGKGVGVPQYLASAYLNS
jgi:hypothetical protein